MNSVEYAAGFFDGEGCIYVGKQRKPKIQLHTDQNVREPLDLLVSLFGGHVYTTKRKSSNGGQTFKWVLGKRIDVYSALQQMKPFLLVKHAKADKVLDLLADYVETLT